VRLCAVAEGSPAVGRRSASRLLPPAQDEARADPAVELEAVESTNVLRHLAWRAWLEVSGITEGPTFRPVDRHGHIGRRRLSGNAVALVMKRRAARAGLDPVEVAGHSLRAGPATSATAAGVPERVIAQQTGHKGTAMLRRYIREGSLFRENAASAVGL